MIKSKNVFLPILIFIISFITYSVSLDNDFVYDDYLAVKANPIITSLKNIPAIFSTDYWNTNNLELASLYRPLTIFSYAINYSLSKYEPFSYHLFNIIIHGLNSVLLYLLLLRLFKNLNLAAISSVFFAVLPVHSEAVISIVGRSELLSFFFVILSLILYNKYCEVNSTEKVYLLLSMLSFLFALLSKENAVSLLLLLPLFTFCFVDKLSFRDFFQKLRSRLILHYSGYIFIFIMYLMIRYFVLHKIFALNIAFDDNPLIAEKSVITRFLTAFDVLNHYISLILFPLTLSADYSYNQIPIIHSLFTNGLIVSIICITFFLIILIIKRKNYFVAFFSAFFFVGSYVIVSNIFFLTGTIMGERLIYLPSVGFCILLGFIFNKAFERFPKILSITIAVVLVIIISLYSFRITLRDKDWQDNFTFFEKLVQTSPNSAKAHLNYALSLKIKKKYDEEISELEIALRINPKDTTASIRLAEAYMNMNRTKDAEKVIIRGLKNNPDDESLLNFYSILKRKSET